MFQNDTFGIYVHLPFCLQKCGYCDFATLPRHGARVDDYIDTLCFEITSRAPLWQHSISGSRSDSGSGAGPSSRSGTSRRLTSIYFGGGTPSLLSPRQLIKIKNTILKAEFNMANKVEVSIEINPGTLSKTDFKHLQAEGFNRFSLGGQTFNSQLLKACGREHSAAHTLQDLKILSSLGCNYSFDLLFALPQQNLKDVEHDLQQLLVFEPPHISAYCLTLPKGHRMQEGRARGDEQVKMFQLIEHTLGGVGVEAYEVSNFARPGFESRHNTLYWTGAAYWGVGLSSHSYLPPATGASQNTSTQHPTSQNTSTQNPSMQSRSMQNTVSQKPWGLRFWNAKNLKLWSQQVRLGTPNGAASLFELLPPAQREALQLHEAMSDFCHTRLRRRAGFNEPLLQVFPSEAQSLIVERLRAEARKGLVECCAAPEGRQWRLSARGVMLSDQVFEAMTFLPHDLERPISPP